MAPKFKENPDMRAMLTFLAVSLLGSVCIAGYEARLFVNGEASNEVQRDHTDTPRIILAGAGARR